MRGPRNIEEAVGCGVLLLGLLAIAAVGAGVYLVHEVLSS